MSDQLPPDIKPDPPAAPKPPEVDEDDKPMTRREFKEHMAKLEEERKAKEQPAPKSEVEPRPDPPKPADPPPPADPPKPAEKKERHAGFIW